MNNLEKNILLSLEESFKTLNVLDIQILDRTNNTLKILVISDDFFHLSIPERVESLTKLLRVKSLNLSLNYAISFQPLTPNEFLENKDDIC